MIKAVCMTVIFPTGTGRGLSSMDGRYCLFGGTSEGRQLGEVLSSLGVEADMWVATEYGERLVHDLRGICVRDQRLDSSEMEEMFRQRGYEAVIDATHPFARIVSANILEAARNAGVEVVRVVRQAEKYRDCIYFDTIEECVDYLNTCAGRVLLTTGSKDLGAFTKVMDYDERIYPRVLPVSESLDCCLKLGYRNKNIICMQGPFSRELNAATLNQLGADWLVTKETAGAGGYDNKVMACRDTGAKCLVIRMPNEQGLTLNEAIKWLTDRVGGVV